MPKYAKYVRVNVLANLERNFRHGRQGGSCSHLCKQKARELEKHFTVVFERFDRMVACLSGKRKGKRGKMGRKKKKKKKKMKMKMKKEKKKEEEEEEEEKKNMNMKTKDSTKERGKNKIK